ncbi:MAG: 50S ribosomal protein L4 [Patescibacteria group bacterium]|nr:50S ribosomal protein L4 [Patescibacteria group bacterium]
MEVTVYNLNKEKVDTLKVPDFVFNAKWNPDLIHQVLVAQQANSRSPVAHTKGRGEVSGGGKKPWRQKGTGRARHGSIRSPLWKGGGVTHGPTKEKKFEKEIPKKMKRGAIFSVLSKKYLEGDVLIVDSLNWSGNLKTKEAKKALEKIADFKNSHLFVLGTSNKEKEKALKNIPRFDCLSPLSLNVYDLLKPKKIILEKEAVEEIINHYKLRK